MNLKNSSDSLLRRAAALLISLPAIVAMACFAHGHGTLGSASLSAVLIACVGVGAVAAYRLLKLTQRGQAMAESRSDLVVAAALRRPSH